MKHAGFTRYCKNTQITQHSVEILGFSNIQILHEINPKESRSSKIAVFDIVDMSSELS